MENIPFLIFNDKNEKIFSIENDGTINWMKNGKLTKAKTIKDLSLALGKALEEFVRLNSLYKQKLELEVK